MVIADLLKTRLNQGNDPGLFYLRDDKGFEIDLIVKQGRSLMPVEIKSSMTFNADFIKPIRVFCEREKAAHAPALIYAGEPLPDVHGVRCVNYGSAHALLTTDR